MTAISLLILLGSQDSGKDICGQNSGAEGAETRSGESAVNPDMEVARIGAELVKLHQTNAIKAGRTLFCKQYTFMRNMPVMIKTLTLLAALVLGAGTLEAVSAGEDPFCVVCRGLDWVRRNPPQSINNNTT